ncbi:hypothetical protein DY000_02046346 [Brassica cretica]|uniref:Uncharacterized protein n=1 Tax=Brassica cretica TaxID=69181 RepID=A0ABQ7EYI4_BRACR|nr:hypothetical protein DY000_02046346 [Brassica cretica]
MGRMEKSTMGLGYQGETSNSQTVFVRGKSVEQDKTRVDLDEEFSCVAMSGLLEWGDTKENYDFTSLANLHQHIKSERPDHDHWEFLRSEEHLDHKFDGDPIFYFSDRKQVIDFYIYELCANSYDVDPYIPCKFVKPHFVKKKPVLISEMMQGLMVTFAVALMTDLLGISKRLKLILNSASKSLSFGHSSLEEEETISLVLSYYLLYFPTFEKEELDTFNSIHEQLLNREMDESGSTNWVIFCSSYAISHDFHCTSMALVLETRLTLVFFTGSTISHTSLPGFLHIRMILVVTIRIHVVASFRDRPALFLPWFSEKLIMTGFGAVLFSEFVRIAQISLHHPIFDLLIDQKSFGDREKYKVDIKCLVAKIDCFLVDVLDGKKGSKLLWPPGTLTVRALLPFPLMISPVALRICLVSISIIINTTVMQFAKILGDRTFDTFEYLRK